MAMRLDDRAVKALAADLYTDQRREQLGRSIDALVLRVRERPVAREAALFLAADVDLAWRLFSLSLLAEVIDTKNILFGSEMVGAVRGIDPETGQYFDDTKRYIDALPISDAGRHAIFEGNARRVFPRLDAQLRARGL